MVAVRAEQAEGAAAKAWSSLARRLAASAAVLVLAVGSLPLPARANEWLQTAFQSHSQPVSVMIMRSIRGDCLTAIRLIALWLRWRLSRRKPAPDHIEAYAC